MIPPPQTWGMVYGLVSRVPLQVNNRKQIFLEPQNFCKPKIKMCVEPPSLNMCRFLPQKDYIEHLQFLIREASNPPLALHNICL